jgi:hypothetical protein
MAKEKHVAATAFLARRWLLSHERNRRRILPDLPCMLAGLILTVICRAVLIRLRLDPWIRPRALAYPCLESRSLCLCRSLLPVTDTEASSGLLDSPHGRKSCRKGNRSWLPLSLRCRWEKARACRHVSALLKSREAHSRKLAGYSLCEVETSLIARSPGNSARFKNAFTVY